MASAAARTGSGSPMNGRPQPVVGSGSLMDDVSPYLYSYAMRAATHFRAGTQASITFRHHGATVRAASSDERSARCDQVEALTDGPCVAALDRSAPVLVPDLHAERRWTEWRSRAVAEGFTSALAAPAHVGPGMDVALNLYSQRRDPWDERAVCDADTFARRIAGAIGMRVHFSTDDPPQVYADLTGPQVVAQAVRAVMQCNACDRGEALDILLSASRHRNVDLEHVAATVLLALTGVAAGSEPRASQDAGRAAGQAG